MEFLEKYEPSSIKEMIANRKQAHEICSWLKNWKPGKGLILHGPVGSGKSLATKLAAKELNYEILYFYGNNIEDVLSYSEQRSIFHKGKLIVSEKMNEKLLKLNIPVVFICDDLYKVNKNIRSKCKIIKFNKVRADILLKFAKDICENERILYTERGLSQLVRMSDGDVRSLLIDLEILKDEKINMKNLEKLGYRERIRNIFDVLKIIFKTKSINNIIDVLKDSDKSIEDILLWIEENIANEYEKPKEIAIAFNFLSKADLFLARIIRRQAWSLKKYVNIGIYGVALGKDEPYKKFVNYRPPRSKFIQENETLEKISKELHCSKNKAKIYLPLLAKLNSF